MRPVQILLTDEQAELAAAALRDAEAQLVELQSEDDGFETTSEQREVLQEDIARLGRLSLLFQDASENPAKYPPSPKMAASIKRFRKTVQGEAQPQSLRKKRSGRHQRRRATRHFFRRNRDLIEGVNRAREMYEKEAEEHAQAVAEIEERVKDQPKFTVTDGFGNTIMAGVPAEFILDAEGLPLEAAKGKIHVVERRSREG